MDPEKAVTPAAESEVLPQASLTQLVVFFFGFGDVSQPPVPRANSSHSHLSPSLDCLGLAPAKGAESLAELESLD